jgi:hypothetical protein
MEIVAALRGEMGDRLGEVGLEGFGLFCPEAILELLGDGGIPKAVAGNNTSLSLPIAVFLAVCSGDWA